MVNKVRLGSNFQKKMALSKMMQTNKKNYSNTQKWKYAYILLNTSPNQLLTLVLAFYIYFVFIGVLKHMKFVNWILLEIRFIPVKKSFSWKKPIYIGLMPFFKTPIFVLYRFLTQHMSDCIPLWGSGINDKSIYIGLMPVKKRVKIR